MRRHPLITTEDPAPSRLPDSIRRLWVAVIEGAITDLRLEGRVRPKLTTNSAHPEMERAWFLSDATTPASFLWVCRLLDLEPDYLRRGILTNVHRRTMHHTTQVRATAKMGQASRAGVRRPRENATYEAGMAPKSDANLK